MACWQVSWQPHRRFLAWYCPIHTQPTAMHAMACHTLPVLVFRMHDVNYIGYSHQWINGTGTLYSSFIHVWNGHEKLFCFVHPRKVVTTRTATTFRLVLISLLLVFFFPSKLTHSTVSFRVLFWKCFAWRHDPQQPNSLVRFGVLTDFFLRNCFPSIGRVFLFPNCF